MKLTNEAYGNKVTIETENDDQDIYEIIELVKQLLLGASYHPKTIDDYFNEMEKE